MSKTFNTKSCLLDKYKKLNLITPHSFVDEVTVFSQNINVFNPHFNSSKLKESQRLSFLNISNTSSNSFV
jgi:hypothetical protein